MSEPTPEDLAALTKDMGRIVKERQRFVRRAVGDDEARAGTAAALESAKGMLRSTVGQQLGMKFTPTLEFVLDATPETARHIEDLLAQVQASDAAAAAAAAGKTFAGEADPYRQPRDDFAEDADEE